MPHSSGLYYSNLGIIKVMPGDQLTLAEAASRLGVSRRRVEAMVLNGQLPAERLGHQWVVAAASVRTLDHTMWREPGRPMAQSSAWKLVDRGAIFGDPQRIDDLDRLRRRLRSRARHLEVYVHPSLLQRLSDDDRVVLGGRAAAEHLGAPVDVTDSIDAYVRTGDEQELLHELAASEVNEGANVHLHVIDDAAWPFDVDQRHVDGWVAWLDLAD
jgi:excisionase family DNA binding protein